MKDKIFLDFFRDLKFLGIFLDFYNFIFRFKTFKINKKMQKVFNFCAGPCGCDVALRATWQRHAGPRGVCIYLSMLYSTYIYNG